MVDAPAAAVLPLRFGAVGISAAHPGFWPLPTSLLNGAAAAGGVALLSSIGNPAASAGP
jgi:ACS family tartrate transporter-like MFS transporter